VSRCRFGWYERGRVVRHVAGRQRQDVPKDEPSAPARLLTQPGGIRIVETEMSGSTWYGRLAPKRAGLMEGVVLLFERPLAKGK
jgi:hypothetical protein